MLAEAAEKPYRQMIRLADESRNDLRNALRQLSHSPGFALGSVAILSLAIGANTLLFTFFSAYLLKPLPMKDPRRNIELTAKLARGLELEWWSYADFSQFRMENRALDEMYAWSPVELPMREPSPRKMKGVLVSGNFFRIFNARMILGRAFGPEEDNVPGRDAVVVLSHNAWRSAFNADSGIVGRTIRIWQTAFTIIGVTEEAFSGNEPITTPDLWAPVVMRDQLVTAGSQLADPETACLRVAGILKPGLSLAQAADSMHGTIMSLNARRPPGDAMEYVRLRPRETYIPLAGEVLAAVVFVFAAFALVLLIACANLAGILLARGAARQREFAIRAALGASRGRLVRQLLTESVLLCAIAAVPSLLLTRAGANAIQQKICTVLIADGYSVQPVSPDWRVFLFTAALAFAAGILLGLAPALEAAGINLAGNMRDGGIRGDSRPRRLRSLLVVSQVAASLVLMVITGIFMRAAHRIGSVDLGFDIDRVIDVRADGTKHQLIERIRVDPRFEAVSEVFRAPLDAHGLKRLAASADGQTQGWALGFNYVDSQYFETLGIPVRLGRSFIAQETRAQAPVVVVSEATARLLWPNQSPIGKTVEVVDPSLVGLDPRAVRFVAGKYEVIGMVQDVVSGIWSGRPDRTAIYLPALPGDPRNRTLLVRSRDASQATRDALKKLCADVDGVNACEPITLRETAARLRLPFVAASGVSLGVGALALVVTSIGLYSLVAFAMVQRTREIGIRIALGAAPLNVLRLMVAGSALRVAIGIALGIPLCIVFSKIAASAFFTIKAFDLVAYVASPLFLTAVTLAAAYVPARRATRIDPMIALRQQ